MTLSFLAGQSYRFEKSSPFAGQSYQIGNKPSNKKKVTR